MNGVVWYSRRSLQNQKKKKKFKKIKFFFELYNDSSLRNKYFGKTNYTRNHNVVRFQYILTRFFLVQHLAEYENHFLHFSRLKILETTSSEHRRIEVFRFEFLFFT